MDLSFQIETQISKNFSRENEESQSLMGFKEFVTEDSDAVISQIRQIRDQMRVIRIRIHLIAFPSLRISKIIEFGYNLYLPKLN